jgi:hypothetical protein
MLFAGSMILSMPRSSWFEIGKGYYGLTTGSVKLHKADLARANGAFEAAFSIPSKDILADSATEKATSREFREPSVHRRK